MPYIAAEDRADLDPHSAREAMTAGELCYQITVLADGFLAGNLTFSSWSEVCSALESTKLETWARLIGPYESQKREINGEVYVTRVPALTATARHLEADRG